MELKKTEPQTIFFETVTTTLREIHKYIGSTPARLMQEAEEAGFKLSGPQVWQYDGATGMPDDEFKLTIAVPIEDTSSSHDKVKQLDTFYCAEREVKGSWDQFAQVYPEFIDNLMKEKKVLTYTSREIYHRVDFDNPENNITAIQIGIMEN